MWGSEEGYIHMGFRTGIHIHGIQNRDGMHRVFRTGVACGAQNS